MATYTSNLNLKKPALDDDALITDINNNMDILDAAANGIEDALAIVANGNTHAAITSGQFVYVRNHSTLTEGLYVASSNIAANATLSSSNLTADSKGGLNALSEQIANKTTPEALTVVLANDTSTMNRYHAQRIGKMVWFSVNFTTSVQLNAESALFRIDTSGGTNVVPITQSSTKIIYFSNNEMKFYTLQKSDNKYYVVPASQINANSSVILNGCFVCE